MSIKEYVVDRDKFEADEDALGGFCFPCIACEHRNNRDDQEPCRTCDHNANAVGD